MLKLLYLLTDGNDVKALAAFYIVSLVITVIITALFLHIYKGKKVRPRSRVIFGAVVIVFAFVNWLSIKQIVSVEQVILPELAWRATLTLLCRINIATSLGAVPLLVFSCLLRNIKQAWTKARKDARKRRQEEYY